MFYKNTLFVFPIFWFGIFSVFSGTAIYETIMYQFYNIFFTSIPIMYFAIYDFEHEKKELLENPKHYSLGFKSKIACGL
jgi:magnesium-transporting ATPase (P-type)